LTDGQRNRPRVPPHALGCGRQAAKASIVTSIIGE
jgi:hypothetical protein